MEIKQLNEENNGINSINFVINGYQHHDALWFGEDKHITYKALAHELYNNLIAPNNFKTILELGSGAGSLAFFLREISNDLTVVTLDGNRESVGSPYINEKHHFIVRTDRHYNLVDKNEKTIKFDLVISFEHFEHISPGEDFLIFLENIKNHIHENTLILATASLQGEGVDHWHPNVKSYEKWKEFLENEKFELTPSNFVRDDTVPFNFPVHLTNELFFKLK